MQRLVPVVTAVLALISLAADLPNVLHVPWGGPFLLALLVGCLVWAARALYAQWPGKSKRSDARLAAIDARLIMFLSDYGGCEVAACVDPHWIDLAVCTKMVGDMKIPVVKSDVRNGTLTVELGRGFMHGFRRGMPLKVAYPGVEGEVDLGVFSTECTPARTFLSGPLDEGLGILDQRIERAKVRVYPVDPEAPDALNDLIAALRYEIDK